MPEFHPTVGDAHRQLELSDWDDVYVFGDVHGCLEPFERLLSTLDVTDDDLVVIVGDLVRKGPDSAGVVDRVRNAENIFSVRGNNEEKLLRGEKTVEGIDGPELEWLRSLPVAIHWDGGLVVHGGVDPREPLAAHTIDDLQNTRSLAPDGGYESPFWYERHEGPPRVFFGHTVLESPVDREWAVGLDTGCVYGGDLTAYDVRRETFHSVPGRHDSVTRSSSKIVTPARTPD
jgi:serine/threonine protein phosphatase 1